MRGEIIGERVVRGFGGLGFLGGCISDLGLFGFGKQYATVEEILQTNFIHQYI